MLKTKKGFFILYCLIWALVFSAPYLRSMQDISDMRWNRMIGDWGHLFFFFIVFLVNIYLLVPKLLFNNKRAYYYTAVVISILVITILDIIILNGIKPPEIPIEGGLPGNFRTDSIFAPHSLLPTFFNNLITGILIIGTGTAFELQYKWLEEEKLRKDIEKEQLKNNLALLKNQISPHFLFNNLSVLTSLVYKNQDKAVEFINELSKVYRYVLDNNNAELVTLQDEMDFLEHYIYLLKIRFENSISFDIKIEESKKQEYVLPMCLQMLVENTIQHNVASQANPLLVSIYTNNNSLIVENQIQPRNNLNESSKTGLTNLISRYLFFTDEKIEFVNNSQVFKVILPLIFRK